jgi:hypothetical protein
MAKDYNAINFKNKDIDRFSTRFGNGDPKKKADQTSAPAPTIPEFEIVAPKSTEKDWREKSRIGALVGGTPYVGGKDKGGKKNCVVKEGKGGRPNYNKMDDSCKNPNAK